jgi:hypothetical protein
LRDLQEVTDPNESVVDSHTQHKDAQEVPCSVKSFKHHQFKVDNLKALFNLKVLYLTIITEVKDVTENTHMSAV